MHNRSVRLCKLSDGECACLPSVALAATRGAGNPEVTEPVPPSPSPGSRPSAPSERSGAILGIDQLSLGHQGLVISFFRLIDDHIAAACRERKRHAKQVLQTGPQNRPLFRGNEEK